MEEPNRVRALVGVLASGGMRGDHSSQPLESVCAVCTVRDSVGQGLPVPRPVRAALVVLMTRRLRMLRREFLRRRKIGWRRRFASESTKGFPFTSSAWRIWAKSRTGTTPDWTEVARQQGVEYFVVVVLSSTEQEYPVSLFLGWTTHMQPGFRRDNWSLAEAALVDGRTGNLLLHAEGRAMATLDSPTAPGINQWYPVIYFRPADPERRIWPPTYEGAPVTLRVVSMEQAAKRLAGNLQRAWVDQRDLELAAITTH